MECGESPTRRMARCHSTGDRCQARGADGMTDDPTTPHEMSCAESLGDDSLRKQWLLMGTRVDTVTRPGKGMSGTSSSGRAHRVPSHAHAVP